MGDVKRVVLELHDEGDGYRVEIHNDAFDGDNEALALFLNYVLATLVEDS